MKIVLLAKSNTGKKEGKKGEEGVPFQYHHLIKGKKHFPFKTQRIIKPV